jgi:hypothetical protein
LYLHAVKIREQDEYDDALSAVADSVKLFRWLATYRPERASWLYAATLNFQRQLLDKTDRNADLLAVAEEAVGAWRKIAATDPTRRPNLFDALTNLAISLERVGRLEESAVHLEEALIMQGRLVREEQSRLALDLSNLAIVRQHSHAFDEALPAIAQAVGIRRSLVDSDPGERPALASDLRKWARILNALDRPDEALAPAQEALVRERELSAEASGVRSELAEASVIACHILGRLHRHEEALMLAKENLALRKELAGENQNLPSLASAWKLVGDCYHDLADREPAVVAYQTAIAVRRRLAADGVDQRSHLVDLLTTTALLHRELEQPEEALAHAVEAVEISRELATEDPAYQNELVNALHMLGDVHENQGNLESAVALNQEAINLLADLAVDNHDQLHHLSLSLDDLASLLERLDRPAEAFLAEQRAAALREPHDPNYG